MEPPKLLIHDHEGFVFEIIGDSDIHLVSFDNALGWLCSCEDYGFRKRFCKHMRACAEHSRIKSRKVYGGNQNG